MSEIARRLTGLSGRELIETDFATTLSGKSITCPDGARVRQSVRVALGIMTGPEDLNEYRKKLANLPRSLR
jgi:hypothetical protein